MKTRTDFVSNSSSTSFICSLVCDLQVIKYIEKFDELLQENIDSKKLFDFVCVDISKLEKDDLEVNFDQYIDHINFFKEYHNLKFKDNYRLVKFVEFLCQYMNSPNKERLKNSIIGFISNRQWEDIDFDLADYLEDLRKYLTDNNIQFETNETFV